MRYFLLIFFCCFNFIFSAYSQDENENTYSSEIEESAPAKKVFYLLSPRVSVTVPHPMSNKAFKKSFVGIYEISGGLNLMLYKGLFIGGTYKNGLLKITENKIADYNASMSINNYGIKLGGDFYLGEKNRVIFSTAITAGQNNTKYSGLVCKNPLDVPKIDRYSSRYVEPEINMFFLVESNFGIGLTLSYSIFDKNFDPYELCLNDWASYSKDNPGNTRYLSFGFGFYYSLIRKKSKLKGGY